MSESLYNAHLYNTGLFGGFTLPPQTPPTYPVPPPTYTLPAPYTQFTLGNIEGQLATLLDDQSGVYWVAKEKQYAIWEALNVWGALTGYWRARGEFHTNPAQTNPYYDMSVLFPMLRARSATLGQMVEDIQYMSLEPPSGVSGAGMSGQINIGSILIAIANACYKFFVDAGIPFSINVVDPSPIPDEQTAALPQRCVILHRCMWFDAFSGVWYPLWRQDAWTQDHGDVYAATEPSIPKSFSESELAPLMVQVYPAPVASGLLEAVTVDSQTLDLSNANQTFAVPNEWVHAIKYGALTDLYSGESQNVDPLRAKYADTRYRQAIMAVKGAKSIIRATSRNQQMSIDSLAAMDAGMPYWRNQTGNPSVAGVMYDILAVAPQPVQTYPVTVDMVRSAPIPLNGNDFIQVGREDIGNILDYASHILTFKCGGVEFQNTFPQYDSFMQAVERRKAITAAKILYLKAIFGQPKKEMEERPDSVG